MNTAEVKEYLADFQQKALPSLVERELGLAGTNKIVSIIGPRRAGKTYFFYQVMQSLLKSGVSRENIVYLHFEDTRLIGLDFKEIRGVLKLHWQLYPSSAKEKLYVFVDEPQNVENWEVAVRELYDEGFSVFVTGSSSKLLSKEIATSLRGRTLSYVLLPFSFREFLKMKNYSVNLSVLGSREKSLLLNCLDRYMEYGGFPDIISEQIKENRVKAAEEYFNLIVYRDIVERYKIKNIRLIKWFLKSIISSFSGEFSVHKTFQTLKSSGAKVSKNTLYSYLSMVEDAMFGFFVPRFAYSARKTDLSIHKVYLCDVVFAKLIETSPNIGKRMENVVYLELERRRRPSAEVFYWKNPLQEEVDFVLKEGSRVRQLIQVCYDLSNLKTKKREVRALLKASKELKCRNLLVITEDKEGEETMEGKKVRYVPLWKWLLQKR